MEGADRGYGEGARRCRRQASWPAADCRLPVAGTPNRIGQCILTCLTPSQG